MKSYSQLAISLPLATEVPSDDWVVTLSLDQPRRVLSGGVQWAERGQLRGFFDGLLFEREALPHSNDLSHGACSDADHVLRAYECGGDAALSRLRGSFVFAIIDRAQNKAIVARDPMGTHPLFYAEVGSCVLFASAPQTLLNRPGVSHALNRAAIADHLCHRWPDPRETFFTAVRRVPPTWRAVLSGGTLRLERYWDPLPAGPDDLLTAEETARFDEVFECAVDRCLRNGPTGVFLSGGLDSISVAAVATDRARQIGHNPPWALSLDFPDPECNERERQTAVARELGLRQHLVDFHEALGDRPLFEQALVLNQGSAAPIINVYEPAYLSLARRARLDGVRTILTGQGGDESLTVSPFLSADLIRRGALMELLQFFGAARRSYRLHPLKLARNMLWTFGLRPLAGLAIHRLMPEAHQASRVRRLLAGDPAWVAPDPALRAEQKRRAENALPPSNPQQGFYEREMRMSLDHTLVSWETEERFECGKGVDIHFLHPFLDPDVVELCFRSLPHRMNGGGRFKGLVRGTIGRRFPALGLERQRKVTAAPFYQSLLLREETALAEAVGDFPALSALGIADGRVTRAFIREGMKQSSRGLARLFNIICAEMWVRSYAH